MCYQYPTGREAEFESAAMLFELPFEWGVTPGADDADGVFALGDYLYTVSTSAQRLRIFNITTKTGGHLPVGELALSSPPKAIYLYRNAAYIVCSDGAIIGVNIDNPAAPTLNGTKTNAGQNWSHIFVVAGTVVASGPNSTGIGLFTTGNGAPREILIYNNSAGGTSIAVAQGRNLFFGSASGGGLRRFNLGGHSCPWMEIGSLESNRINAEEFSGRHVYIKGEAVVRELTVFGTGGEIGTTAIFTILDKTIFASKTVPDPNGIQSAKLSSLYLASDGTVWRLTTEPDTWTAM